MDVTAGGVLQPGRAAWVFAAAPTRLVVSQPTPTPSPSPPSSASPAPPGTGSLALTPLNPSVQVFSYVQLNATGATGPLEWSSSVPSVAAVDSQGLVRGLNKGQATVTVRSAGQAAETTVTVTDNATPPGSGGTPAASPTPTLFVPSVISRQNGLLGAPAAVTDNGSSFNYIPRQVSDDGRYAVFISNAVPGSGSALPQVYRRDLTTGATELASSHNGNAGPFALQASISPDGRYVAFTAYCGSPPENDFGGGGAGPFTGGSATRSYVYLRDMNGPTLRLVSCAAGQPTVRASFASAPDTADQPAVSTNGSFVAYRYRGAAPNAITGPTAPALTANRFHVYRADMTGGTPVARVLSVAPTGATGVLEGNADSDQPSISSDGRYVAYHSAATNLIPSSTGLGDDVFRADGTAVQADVQLASRPFGSVAPSGASGAQDFPSISADGRYVALRTSDSGLYQAGSMGVPRQAARVDLGSGLPLPVIHASADTGGGPAGSDCNLPFLAGNAGYVAFTTTATDLGTPSNGSAQLVRRNLSGTAYTLASQLSGTPADSNVLLASLTGDGQQAIFVTAATNLGLNSPPFRYLYHVFLGP